MPSLFFIGLIVFAVFQCSAVLVYAIWISPFVECNGGRPASLGTHLLLGDGWLREYRQARSLSRRLDHVPWFMRLFEALEAAALAGFMLGVWSTLVGS